MSQTNATMDVPRHYYDEADNETTCLICDNAQFEIFRKPDHFGLAVDFYRCSGCGLVKQAPMPNEGFFEWFFNSDLFFSSKKTDTDEIWGFYDYFKDESCRLRTSKRRFRLLSKLLNWNDSKRDFMKIGPSTGTFLHVANQAGHHAIGCDVSDRFVGYAKENYDVRIDHGRFEKMGYAENSFDAVMMFNVVENIPNLHEVLDSIASTVKPGGHFVVNHVEMKGNLIERFQKDKYFIYRPPICYAFERDTLDRLMAAKGFVPQKRFRDIRFMHLEKITTLLRWRWALKLSQWLRISRIEFPIWGYPSWITVYRRNP